MSNSSSSHLVSARLRRYVITLVAMAVPVLTGAVLTLARDPRSLPTMVGAGIFTLASVLAEFKPVPLDERGGRSVSLSFVFLLSTQMLFGWQWAVVAAAISTGTVAAFDGSSWIRRAFNTSMYVLAAFASAVPGFVSGIDHGHLDPSNTDRLTLLAFSGGAAYIITNVSLVSGVVSIATHTRLRDVLEDNVRHSGLAFVIMAFIAGLATSLWKIRPQLEVLLAGPLFAVALYQRYAYRTVVATRDAETDALTGLGNHRLFQNDLAAAVDDSTAGELALCLIDLDNFKGINDRYGHSTGDQVLVEVAALLRDEFGAACAYRIGGEEFAVMLSETREREAYTALERMHHRLWQTRFPHGEVVTVSAGIASYPEHAPDRDRLLRVADGALYWAKNHGKNRSCIYSPSVVRIFSPEELAKTAERSARLRAAEGLIRVVDAKDGYAGTHSQSVSRLAEGMARAMGLEPEIVDQVRLAGLLHDLGKIAIPDAILQKPGKLDPDELRIMREHPDLGYRLLDGLGVSPVDRWIRHHHEWWDGSGYPLGLAGDEIPLGSRIILVADAYDAMTTDRVYRAAGSGEAALAELRRRCWTQFDARVAAALEHYLVSPECHLTSTASSSATG